MKPHTLLAAVLLLSACHLGGPLRPVRLTVGADSSRMLTVPVVPMRTDSTAIKARRAAMAAELQYYLERHDMQDEGYDMVARYASRTDTLPTLPPMTALNAVDWRHVTRNGAGMARDWQGRVVMGYYSNDSLRSGLRLDKDGTYLGEFRELLADGHGVYRSATGNYYEGHWRADQREGFGFSTAPDSHVRVGEWKADRYLGERMNYTSDRIYGIDISRYQHGKGKKKYAIEWNRLRISHLGTLSRKRVSGTVDYPVSFVFIKSTEGTAIRNPYYATDNTAAHRAGIPIGAYHFFSCKTSGAAQAQHFLRHTHFRHGDLPPVLDLEPSAAQIAKIGGVASLFAHVRTWLRVVEGRTGTRPILYVSQTFVNRYLSQAPDLKRNYKVWIARYGEFKPDVKLVVWQLCPDGRVQGIRGEVDINVFNGYRQQFDEFLREESIP